MNDIDNKLLNDLPEAKHNVVLRDYVSLKVGGVADYFYVATNIDELTRAVTAAYKNQMPYFILAGGYNIVPSDSGFPGLVIKNESSGIVFGSDLSTAIVDSGVRIGKLINLAAGHDLGGLEFLFGVPGTIGGAVYGNAGAFNYEIGDFVKSVTLLMPQDGKILTATKPAVWVNFSYRNSRFKTDYKDQIFKPVILTVTLQLVQRRKDEIMRLVHDNLQQKRRYQPLEEKSAGSFFKNPDKYAAGYLLEEAGAKKLRVGGAAFSKKHANFLVNRKNATANEVRELAEKAKELVSEKYNIPLEEEIEYIGRW